MLPLPGLKNPRSEKFKVVKIVRNVCVVKCGSLLTTVTSVQNLLRSIMVASEMPVKNNFGADRQIDSELQKLQKEKGERQEGIKLLRNMLKVKTERLDGMEKFTQHLQLSRLLDNLEGKNSKRKNKSKSGNTEDGELKTKLKELEKENKKLKASEKSLTEKMERVEAIYVATLRKKEVLEKGSVKLELVKFKLEDAEKKVVELTKRNKELERKNKKLIERRCQYCPKDNEILSSNVTLKS